MHKAAPLLLLPLFGCGEAKLSVGQTVDAERTTSTSASTNAAPATVADAPSEDPSGETFGLQALLGWLNQHEALISEIADFEVSPGEELDGDWFDPWFGGSNWKAAGYRFVMVGHDGSGGAYCAWFRPGHDGPPPIVLLGSEGERGVMAATPLVFAKAIWHGIEPHDVKGDDVQRLSEGLSWIDGAEIDDGSDEGTALADYRRVSESRFGATGPLDALLGDLDGLNAEYVGWVDTSIQ